MDTGTVAGYLRILNFKCFSKDQILGARFLYGAKSSSFLQDWIYSMRASTSFDKCPVLRKGYSGLKQVFERIRKLDGIRFTKNF